MTIFAVLNMVSVVQLVERQIVVLVVVGSSPTVHPSRDRASHGLFYFPPGLIIPPGPHYGGMALRAHHRSKAGASLFFARRPIPPSQTSSALGAL